MCKNKTLEKLKAWDDKITSDFVQITVGFCNKRIPPNEVAHKDIAGAELNGLLKGMILINHQSLGFRLRRTYYFIHGYIAVCCCLTDFPQNLAT